MGNSEVLKDSSAPPLMSLQLADVALSALLQSQKTVS
jgi:hypothetical protein